MRYEFAHQLLPDWSVDEQALIDKTIDCVLHLPDHKVIERLAQHIFAITQVDYVTISKVINNEPAELGTLTFLKHGKALDNVTYFAAGTPCENVLSHSIFYYPAGVQEQFPEDIYLQHLHVNSYLGIPLNDSENNAIGLVALLHETTILNPGFIDHLLNIIAPTLEEYLLKAS